MKNMNVFFANYSNPQKTIYIVDNLKMVNLNLEKIGFDWANIECNTVIRAIADFIFVCQNFEAKPFIICLYYDIDFNSHFAKSLHFSERLIENIKIIQEEIVKKQAENPELFEKSRIHFLDFIPPVGSDLLIVNSNNFLDANTAKP